MRYRSAPLLRAGSCRAGLRTRRPERRHKGKRPEGRTAERRKPTPASSADEPGAALNAHSQPPVIEVTRVGETRHILVIWGGITELYLLDTKAKTVSLVSQNQDSSQARTRMSGSVNDVSWSMR